MIKLNLSDEQSKAYEKAQELKHNYNRILGENQFLVFMLRDYGFSIDQIANLLDNKPKTVYNLYYQAEEIIEHTKEFYNLFYYDETSTEKLLQRAIRKEEEEIKRISKWYFEVGSKFDYLPEEDRNSELAIGLLMKAETDLKTSKYLRRKSIYAQSIFHIQQSVEKLGKSILLVTGICNENDLKKKVRHDFAEFILSKLRVIFASFRDHEVDSFYATIVTKLDDFLGIYASKRNSGSFILSYAELKDLLSSFDHILNNFEKGTSFLDKNRESVYEEIMPLTLRFINPMLDVFELYTSEELKPETRKEYEKELKNYMENYDIIQELTNTLYVVFLLVYITVLSMHLDSHVTTTRYPESRIKYTKNHDLVRISPLMFKTISRMINIYYYLLSINEDVE